VSDPTEEEVKNLKRNPIYLVLDEIIDTYNIGSLFRLADATGISKVYLCGNMEYPPSSRIHKAAVGTENWVPWEKRDSTFEVVKELKGKSLQPVLPVRKIPTLGEGLPARRSVQIISVEQSPKSIAYSLLPGALSLPCAVVVGNETSGISTEVLKESDVIVELPMHGINKSFNVWGSAAVVIYKILESM